MLDERDATKIESRGWKLSLSPGSDFEAAALAECALKAAGGELGEPFRRSRHASTWVATISDRRESQHRVWVKVFGPPRAMGRFKTRLRGTRAANVARMTSALISSGFRTPRLLALGTDSGSGRSLVMAIDSEGSPLPQMLQQLDAQSAVGLKRKVLRSLGEEVARLHRSGFIHGDLTPYNIFVASTNPPRFVLLDHDRTRRKKYWATRLRLRNLVQLGRFELAGIDPRDRLRVFCAYARASGVGDRRQFLAKLTAMLESRRQQDERKINRAAG